MLALGNLGFFLLRSLNILAPNRIPFIQMPRPAPPRNLSDPASERLALEHRRELVVEFRINLADINVLLAQAREDVYPGVDGVRRIPRLVGRVAEEQPCLCHVVEFGG